MIGGAGICAYDIPTRDKIPALRKLFSANRDGFALDVGSGMGFTTAAVFGRRPTVCMDLHAPNLQYFRTQIVPRGGVGKTYCVMADGTRIPFKAGTFRSILCSEVLEHIEDDDAVVQELARALSADGRLVITVPYIGLCCTSFLEIFRIKTVHDVPGPEYHVRRGYDEQSLGELLARHGLEIERTEYYLRFFSRLISDLVSVSHLLVQRVAHRREAWNWSDVSAVETQGVFRAYKKIFSVLWAFSRMDRWLARFRGFGLVVCVRKRTGQEQARA